MHVPISLKIAIRLSRGKIKGSIVSLVSILSTIGITIGVAILIIGLSAMNGFERELHNRILAIIPHGEIEPVNPPFSNWKKILKQIKQSPGILAVAPYLNFTGLIEHNNKLQAIQIKGLDPELELELSALPNYVQNNAWSHFQAGQQQIIIGKGVANILKVKPGDWITIMISNSDPKMKLLQPKRINLQVIGILMLKGQLDYTIAIVPLADAQRYLQRITDIGGIAIRVNNVFNANKLVRDASRFINSYVKIHSWISTYGYIYRDIQMIRTIIYLSMVLVIGVACFNIVSTLVMAVKDKSTDIAILRTLGANNRLTYNIFIWYGLLSGLIGSFFGVTIGTLIALNLTILMKWLERILDYKLLSSNIYFIDFLPTELHWVDVSSVFGTALMLTFLASWYPARRANQIDPAKVLNCQ